MSSGGFWRSGCATRTADFANHYGYLERVAVRVAKLEAEVKGLAGRLGRKGTETAVLLQEHFNMEELAEICFLLGIEPEKIPGDTMVTRPFELVRMCQRMGLMDALRRLLGEKRPFVDW